VLVVRQPAGDVGHHGGAVHDRAVVVEQAQPQLGVHPQ
jgi:hypothetical protein